MLARALDFSDPHDAAAWDDLAARAPERSPFATRAFGAAIAEARGVTFGAMGVFDRIGPQQTERLVAGVPTFEARRGPFRCAVVPPLTFYTPVLTDPPVREGHVLMRTSALDALLAALQDAFDAVALHLDPHTADVRAFAWAGFDVRPLYTYRFAPDAPYQPDKETRRVLRLPLPPAADGNAPTVVPVSASTPGLYDRLSAHERKPGRRPLFPDGAGPRLLARLESDGLLALTACGDEAALATLGDDRAAYAWLVGTPKGPAATVLFDHAIRQALAAGKTFDFFGANTPSLALFKKAFGGTLTPFYRAAWHRPGLPRWISKVRPLV